MMARRVSTVRIWETLPGAMAICVALLLLASAPARAGQAPGALHTFATPQQAVSALMTAIRNNNDQELLAILGPDAADLIFSGDRVADLNNRARFLKAYLTRNTLEQESADRAVLIIGSRDYPFPLPLVRRDRAWTFDTEAGRQEIINRRIGRNELHTIEVLHAYTDAQREYASLKIPGKGPEFAQKFASSPNARDGLYWEPEAGEPESPFGPLIARATRQGYTSNLNPAADESFHGYYFKIITAQGDHASGGAFDYLVNDRMVLGFALLAYPAKYGVSGIMTFMVNQEGIIYEQDLGKETAARAAAITIFDPDHTWRQTAEPPTP